MAEQAGRGGGTCHGAAAGAELVRSYSARLVRTCAGAPPPSAARAPARPPPPRRPPRRRPFSSCPCRPSCLWPSCRLPPWLAAPPRAGSRRGRRGGCARETAPARCGGRGGRQRKHGAPQGEVSSGSILARGGGAATGRLPCLVIDACAARAHVHGHVSGGLRALLESVVFGCWAWVRAAEPRGVRAWLIRNSLSLLYLVTAGV